jgi:hypothetical protein
MLFAGMVERILTLQSTLDMVPNWSHGYPDAAHLSPCPHHLRPSRCAMARRRAPHINTSRNRPKVLLPQVDLPHTRILRLLGMALWRGLHLVAHQQGQARLHRHGARTRASEVERETTVLAPHVLLFGRGANGCSSLGRLRLDSSAGHETQEEQR